MGRFLTKDDERMPMPASEIERIIKEALPDARIELTALADDNDHWAAKVVSESFRGLPRVRQHQLVNAAFGDRLGTVLHALALTTSTP
jgi:stress-induced morphogen